MTDSAPDQVKAGAAAWQAIHHATSFESWKAVAVR